MPFGIRIERSGPPEVMQWVEMAIPQPGKNEVVVRNSAVGVNFLDTYQRSGLYPMPLPFIPGSEGAGVIESVGTGVTDFKPGDRVAYLQPIGAYAQFVLRPADQLVPIPADIDFATAAAVLLKGVTARFLCKETYAVKGGDTIVVHAAAGGVGQILCQWARHLGATVIGTVSSDAKAEVARNAGCEHVIVTGREKVSARVLELTQNVGVPVVYDSIGKDTYVDSLACLRTRGLLVNFGNSSGIVSALDLRLLAAKSLYVTRPGINSYAGTPAMLREAAADVFDVLRKGVVKISINADYALKDAAQAHRELESRRTTGSLILIP